MSSGRNICSGRVGKDNGITPRLVLPAAPCSRAAQCL